MGALGRSTAAGTSSEKLTPSPVARAEELQYRNEDSENLPRCSSLTSSLGLAGICGVAVGYPLDTVKVRCDSTAHPPSHSESSAVPHGQKPFYAGLTGPGFPINLSEFSPSWDITVLNWPLDPCAWDAQWLGSILSQLLTWYCIWSQHFLKPTSPIGQNPDGAQVHKHLALRQGHISPRAGKLGARSRARSV